MMGSFVLRIDFFENRIAFIFKGSTDILHWEIQGCIFLIWSRRLFTAD